MRKTITLVLAISMILSIGLVFADTEVGDFINWFKDRMELKKDYLQEALEEGTITLEQYEAWLEHYEFMEEYHEENGFPGGMGYGCHGNGSGNQNGFGRGFMGGTSNSNQD